MDGVKIGVLAGSLLSTIWLLLASNFFKKMISEEIFKLASNLRTLN